MKWNDVSHLFYKTKAKCPTNCAVGGPCPVNKNFLNEEISPDKIYKLEVYCSACKVHSKFDDWFARDIFCAMMESLRVFLGLEEDVKPTITDVDEKLKIQRDNNLRSIFG